MSPVEIKTWKKKEKGGPRIHIRQRRLGFDKKSGFVRKVVVPNPKLSKV